MHISRVRHCCHEAKKGISGTGGLEEGRRGGGHWSSHLELLGVLVCAADVLEQAGKAAGDSHGEGAVLCRPHQEAPRQSRFHGCYC